MEKQLWLPIVGFCDYEISEYGQVKNVRLDHVLKPWEHEGYCRVSLRRDNKSHARSVHHLVCTAFHGVSVGLQVNHIDTNRSNNHYLNLEWTTPKENTQHSWRMGHQEARVASLRRKVQIVETAEVFESLTECAKAIGGQVGNVCNVLQGRLRTHKGYTFRYLD